MTKTMSCIFIAATHKEENKSHKIAKCENKRHKIGKNIFNIM